MWAKIDDQFCLNPKNVLDRDEQDLFFAGLIYCSGQLTDGFIPADKLELLLLWAKIKTEANAQALAQAIASRLVDHKYWEYAEGGYQVHDFLDWNMSREEVLSMRKARSEAGKRGGTKSAAKKMEIQALAQANAKQVLEQNSSKVQPSPSPSPFNQSPILNDSRASGAQSECAPAYQLIQKVTGWMGIPMSEENVDLLRDVPTIMQRKGADTEIYLRGFWTTYNHRYPGSTRLGWIGWALTGKIPPEKQGLPRKKGQIETPIEEAKRLLAEGNYGSV
jgi:hypothetical protein